MLQTRKTSLQNCSENVPKCPKMTHRCPEGTCLVLFSFSFPYDFPLVFCVALPLPVFACKKHFSSLKNKKQLEGKRNYEREFRRKYQIHQDFDYFSISPGFPSMEASRRFHSRGKENERKTIRNWGNEILLWYGIKFITFFSFFPSNFGIYPNFTLQ